MNFLEIMLSVMKSFMICLKVFDFKTACKLPLYVKYNTRCIGLRKGCIQFGGDIKRGMVSISTNRGTLLGEGFSPSVVQFKDCGVWKVTERAWCSGSCVINVGGVLETNGFTANGGFKLSCANRITLKQDVLIGWNVTIIDSDGHDIIVDHIVTNKPRSVEIGSHVWICANTILMKGARIGDGSVVAMGSIVTKSFKEKNVLLTGNIIRKSEINWRH